MPPFLINLLIGIALQLAATLIQIAFAQDEKQKVAGVRGSLQTGGDNPLAFIMGFYSTGGQLEYAGTWGHVDETPNAYYTKVVSISDMPVNALTGIFVGGERVTLADTPHASRGYPVLEYRVSGVDHLWIKFYDGSQTEADAFLLATFGSDADRPYLSNMIGRGVPYAIGTARLNRELFSGLPDFIFEVEGMKLYDPRADTTVGGAGLQRVNDPSTWAYSDNPVVAIYNILLGIRYDGIWLFGPQRNTQAQLPFANWTTEMDKCDEEIELLDESTEKRFRFGLEVLCNEGADAAIGELLKACEGRIAEVGGFYKILVGEPAAPVLSVTDDDIVISEGQTYEPFPGFEETVNGVTATYPEPIEAWASKEAPARYDAGYELDDGDNRLPFDTNYKAVPFALQVQRIMEASLLEARRFRKHSFTGRASWWEFEPLDVFAWTSVRNGYTNKQFLITVLEDAPNANQLVGSQEIEPTDFTGWVPEDEIEFDTTPIVISRPEPQPMIGWAVAPYVLVDSTSEGRRPGIEVSYAGGLDDVREVRVLVRRAGETDPFLDVTYPYDIDVSAPVNYIVANAILPNEDYEVSGKFVPYSGRLTDWSAWLEVTTPNIKLGVKDITVELSELGAEIAQQLDWVKNGVRAALDAFAQIGTIIEESDRENYNQREILSRSIGVQLGNLEASFTEVIEVALGPGGAIATALESLYAAMGGNTSQVNVRWQALAGVDGYSARYAIQAAVDDGDWRGATFFMDVPASALDPTRIVLDADQVVFTNSDSDTPLPAVVVEDGMLKFVGARAGRISSNDLTTMWIDWDDPEIFMESVP